MLYTALMLATQGLSIFCHSLPPSGSMVYYELTNAFWNGHLHILQSKCPCNNLMKIDLVVCIAKLNIVNNKRRYEDNKANWSYCSRSPPKLLADIRPTFFKEIILKAYCCSSCVFSWTLVNICQCYLAYLVAITFWWFVWSVMVSRSVWLWITKSMELGPLNL